MSDFTDRAKDTVRAVHEDLTRPGTSAVTRAEVVGVGAALAAKELGLGIALNAEVLAKAYEATGHNAPVAALIVAISSFVVESALSSRVARHLPDMARTVAQIERWHKAQTDHEGHGHSKAASRALGLYNRAMAAFVFGSSGMVIHEFVQNPGADRRRLSRRGRRVAGGLATANGLTALVLSGGIKLAEHVGHEELAEASLNILRNPLLYIGAVGLGAGAKLIGRERRRRRRARNDES